jgi:ABC-type multidrug transport system fused ATPase/permease subunit
MMGKTSTFNKSIPIISVYIFAGYRLMPALQQIYLSFCQLTFIGPSLDKLYKDLKNINSFEKKTQDKVNLLFNDKITLTNIHYNYPHSTRTALKNISLTIPIKSTVGIIGPTGSGKTTIVDIILGLLEAQKGTLQVDQKIITKENARVWQHYIGYVPQQIYLSDDTVAANIAFGIEPNNIDYKMVEKAAKIANLNQFIIEELPEQYQTKIGERGVRLSGGQRQRIGIARALYINPKVLVFDEATSALDNQTEKDVMDAINNLSKDMTIILIAHRLNTVKNCDNIFEVDKGQIINQGTYDEIIKN